MEDQPEKPRPPLPPTSIPPLPPPPELLRAQVPHVPLTPMMDFFQRRLESLEKELSLEREKARSAQGLIQQQEAMRAEVEAQLKQLHDNLRREKAERDSEETKQHARGRIDSLEKRLDEMHGSFVSLLKDAIGTRDSGAAQISKEQASMSVAQAALRQEVTALSAAINGLMEQVSQWRTESQSLAHLAPEVRALSSQIPADGRRVEQQLAQQLTNFSAELRDRISDWERRQELDAQKDRERMEALAREKAALMRAWEEQNHELRQQAIKDKVSRESEVAGLIAEMARRVDELKLEQQRQARETAEVNARIAQTLEMLTATPKAKDQVIEALEREKSDFAKALRDRSESLRRYALERAEIEKTMGESLLRLQGELEREKKRELILSSRVADLELQLEGGKDKLSLKEKSVEERDQRLAALTEERDRLVKVVLGEAGKSRLALEERAKSDEGWAQRLAELQKRLADEIGLRAKESEAVAELRAQIATLTDHMTRALQERDAIASRFSAWEADRQKLLSSLKEKDEMISMLNATFQNMLKK